MWKDPIIEEARKRREELAGKFGHELDAICEAIKKKEAAQQVVQLPPRKARPAKKIA
ncbi:MAG TPA: hypothetical protein PLR50_06190 [Candidatus Rifleibacterium sp.]|jgi:hypothetical protein|nr:hypothetical protein [Candidatus Rifleibacterium sp.]